LGSDSLEVDASDFATSRPAKKFSNKVIDFGIVWFMYFVPINKNTMFYVQE
jgi:hypothetical protein